jgi:hypothetical protein
MSGARGRDPQAVAVRVFQITFAPGETLFIDRNPELLRYGIDVIDVEVDQCAWRCVAAVFREIKPNPPAGDANEPRQSWLELMLPLLLESEALVPLDSAISVVHTEHRHDRFIHRAELKRRVRRACNKPRQTAGWVDRSPADNAVGSTREQQSRVR